ncbi:hypothetical protein PRZ48_010620 [Zasmidium cellare]|uniref:Uncharacterized protein n=1 Tax=Zasmidium cellare TaxID=395010 RepID=A0ABR0E952_ZASCE|nr:hypothetical protein PRZ48_010620 [Zasmidium cellare]
MMILSRLSPTANSLTSTSNAEQIRIDGFMREQADIEETMKQSDGQVKPRRKGRAQFRPSDVPRSVLGQDSIDDTLQSDPTDPLNAPVHSESEDRTTTPRENKQPVTKQLRSVGNNRGPLERKREGDTRFRQSKDMDSKGDGIGATETRIKKTRGNEADPVPLTPQDRANDNKVVRELCGFDDDVQSGELEGSNDQLLDDAEDDAHPNEEADTNEDDAAIEYDEGILKACFDNLRASLPPAERRRWDEYHATAKRAVLKPLPHIDVVPTHWKVVSDEALARAQARFPALKGWVADLFHHLIAILSHENARKPFMPEYDPEDTVAPISPPDARLMFKWHYPTHVAGPGQHVHGETLDRYNPSTGVISRRFYNEANTAHVDKYCSRLDPTSPQPYMKAGNIDQRMRQILDECWAAYLRASEAQCIVLVGEVQLESYRRLHRAENLVEIPFEDGVSIYGQPAKLMYGPLVIVIYHPSSRSFFREDKRFYFDRVVNAFAHAAGMTIRDVDPFGFSKSRTMFQKRLKRQVGPPPMPAPVVPRRRPAAIPLGPPKPFVAPVRPVVPPTQPTPPRQDGPVLHRKPPAVVEAFASRLTSVNNNTLNNFRITPARYARTDQRTWPCQFTFGH